MDHQFRLARNHAHQLDIVILLYSKSKQIAGTLDILSQESCKDVINVLLARDKVFNL